MKRPLVLAWVLGAVLPVFATDPSIGPVSEGQIPRTPISAAARLGIKFNPGFKAAEGQAPPQRSADTILMPRYVITDSPVKLTERNVLTSKAKLDLAESNYLHPLYRAVLGPMSQVASYYFNPLSIFGGWHPNETEARMLYQQDERLQMLDEMDSLIGIEKINGPMNAKALQPTRWGAFILTR